MITVTAGCMIDNLRLSLCICSTGKLLSYVSFGLHLIGLPILVTTVVYFIQVRYFMMYYLELAPCFKSINWPFLSFSTKPGLSRPELFQWLSATVSCLAATISGSTLHLQPRSLWRNFPIYHSIELFVFLCVSIQWFWNNLKWVNI